MVRRNSFAGLLPSTKKVTEPDAGIVNFYQYKVSLPDSHLVKLIVDRIPSWVTLIDLRYVLPRLSYLFRELVQCNTSSS